MNIARLSYLVLVFLFPGILINDLSAQWANGYIIGNNNDTVNGKIINLSDFGLLKSVTFSDTLGIQTEYTPTDIKAFYITDDNRYFESMEVQTDSTSEFLFLRCLIKGEVSFYILRTAINRYFVSNSAKFSELINTKQQKTIDGHVYSTFKYEYIITLKTNFLNRCPQLLMEIDKVVFNEKGLYKIIKDYNECAFPQESLNTFQSKKSVINEYIVYISSSYVYPYEWFGTDFVYGGGFSYSVNWPDFSKNVYFSTGTSLEYNHAPEYEGYENYNLFLISFPVYVECVFTKHKTIPYIFGGIDANFYVEKYGIEPYRHVHSFIFIDFPFGAGLKAHRFDFSFQVGFEQMQARVGYRIGK